MNPPLHRASTVLYDSYASYLEADQRPFHGKLYGTYGTPVQLELEAAMAALEGGYACRACHSGLDAIETVLMAFTRAGDHIVVCDNVYGPTRDFCDRVLTKYGVEVDYLPASASASAGPGAEASFFKENTRLLYLESPGSNTFELEDVPALAGLARSRGVVTVVDNTWATPLFFEPFAHGVDVSIHSGSKYLTGGSDALVGTITAAEACFPELESFYETTERFADPEACYTALKGLETLRVRLAQHQTTALAIARWLRGHPAVEVVIHPALDTHPEHALWRRDFKGASGVFGFILKEEPSKAVLSTFMDGMEVFAIGLSWGGFQSLIKPERVGVALGSRAHPCRYEGRTIIRLSIGLEDEDAIKADLEAALARLPVA